MLRNYASLYDGLCILLCIMFKLLISALMSVRVHGLFAHLIGVSSVLFTGRRVWDVTKEFWDMVEGNPTLFFNCLFF